MSLSKTLWLRELSSTGPGLELNPGCSGRSQPSLCEQHGSGVSHVRHHSTVSLHFNVYFCRKYHRHEKNTHSR